MASQQLLVHIKSHLLTTTNLIQQLYQSLRSKSILRQSLSLTGNPIPNQQRQKQLAEQIAKTQGQPIVARSPQQQRVTLSKEAAEIDSTLSKAVQEMSRDLQKMQAASTQVLQSQRELEAQLNSLRKQEHEWHKRAELALYKGEEALAREALIRKQSFEKQANTLDKQLGVHRRAAQQLVGNTRMLEMKIQEAISKKDTLAARAESARMAKQMNEMVSALDMSNGTAVQMSSKALDKLEESVSKLEAEADAAQVLALGDPLEAKFYAMANPGVDDELAVMKQRLASGRPAEVQQKIPQYIQESSTQYQPRPFKDEIELELEKLKHRVSRL